MDEKKKTARLYRKTRVFIKKMFVKLSNYMVNGNATTAILHSVNSKYIIFHNVILVEIFSFSFNCCLAYCLLN